MASCLLFTPMVPGSLVSPLCSSFCFLVKEWAWDPGLQILAFKNLCPTDWFLHLVFGSCMYALASVSDKSGPLCLFLFYPPTLPIIAQACTVSPVPTSTLIWLKRVESGSTESNMPQLGRIQVRKSKETGKYKCASCGAYLTRLSCILPSGVKWELRSGPGLQCRTTRIGQRLCTQDINSKPE
jgi:hypothetical protein